MQVKQRSCKESLYEFNLVEKIHTQRDNCDQEVIQTQR